MNSARAFHEDCYVLDAHIQDATNARLLTSKGKNGRTRGEFGLSGDLGESS